MTVSIVRDQDGAKARDAIGLLGGMKEYIEEKDKVIIKPNICAGKVSQTDAVTDPEVVAEICKMVEECGASPEIVWNVITDYEGYAKLSSFIKKAEVLERGRYRCSLL